MHELGIVQQVVGIVADRAARLDEATTTTTVRRLTLEIGKDSTILPDAVRFCFDVATEGTVLEDASLEIIEVDGPGIRILEMEIR